MPDFTNRVAIQEYFDNIETDFDLGIFQQAQIIQSSLSQPTTPGRVDRRGRAGPVLGRAGFDFHEDEAFVIPEHEIDFTAVGMEICGKKFQAEFLERFFRHPFAEPAAAQVKRPGAFPSGKPYSHARRKIHALHASSECSFACGDFALYNCRASTATKNYATCP
jgi:hypothetical protein